MPMTAHRDDAVRRYLLEVQHEADKILATLPEGIHGGASIEGGQVYVDIRGPRLKAFTLVLGGEAPEIVYDASYIQLCLIGEGIAEQVEFLQETVSAIAEFLLSDRLPTQHHSWILKRPYLLFPMADGTQWRLSKFTK
ncbi:hypothetical protein [Arthrobacter sp. SW1]|uniref:hypothetical protein n=1 Tax=Arthrobacter sp. SW1 TaxID=1920889 RepID=UPI0011131475|nr:hypothetical protein [Arthrobacter sp. SW1]